MSQLASAAGAAVLPALITPGSGVQMSRVARVRHSITHKSRNTPPL